MNSSMRAARDSVIHDELSAEQQAQVSKAIGLGYRAQISVPADSINPLRSLICGTWRRRWMRRRRLWNREVFGL